MLDSKALTKIQPIILISIIVVAALGGVAAYVLLGGQKESSETIKIGVLADIDGGSGSHVWQGAVLAAEHINSEGGILGRQIEVIGGDTDEESGIDMTKINSVLTRLLTLDDVDFVIGGAVGERGYMIQDTTAEHKKIYISYGGIPEGLNQRVIDDYDKYKYFFHYSPNSTILLIQQVESLLLL